MDVQIPVFSLIAVFKTQIGDKNKHIVARRLGIEELLRLGIEELLRRLVIEELLLNVLSQ